VAGSVGRAVVIGGGAWGLAAAVALKERGIRRVDLFERESLGAGATLRAAGIFSSHLRTPQDVRLSLVTRHGLAMLEDWGRREGFAEAGRLRRVTGGLTLASRGQRPAIKAMVSRVRAARGHARFVKGRALRKRAQGVLGTRGLVAAWSQDDTAVDLGAFVSLLRRRAAQLGVGMHTGRAVEPAVRTGRVVGVHATGDVLEADAVVVAAGAWTRAVVAGAGLDLPLRSYRTQLARFRRPHHPGLPIVHDATAGAYFRPDGPDRVVAGNGTRLVEADPEAYDRAADAAFLRRARDVLDARLGGEATPEPEASGAGLCVATPDRWPLLGPVPDVPGLHLFVGDNGYGVMRSLGLAQWVARGVADGSRPAEAGPMAAARFDLRDPPDFGIREGFTLEV
jgi:sarcosine oxidase subunit beta